MDKGDLGFLDGRDLAKRPEGKYESDLNEAEGPPRSGGGLWLEILRISS